VFSKLLGAGASHCFHKRVAIGWHAVAMTEFGVIKDIFL